MAKETCHGQHKTRYIRLPDLLEEYAEKSVLPGRKNKVLNKFAVFKVLVLDEWLMPELNCGQTLLDGNSRALNAFQRMG